MDGADGNDRELRRLRQKLLRAEENRRRLEDQREGSAMLHAAVIRELEASQRELEASNAQLLAIQEQLARSERLATQASRAKSTFLANMSHELRTPLNAILGYAELLREELDDESIPVGAHELGQIHVAGRHLLGLIDQILDLSKIEAGRMQLDLALVDVEALVDEIVATVEPAARRKGLALRARCDAGGPVWTDGRKVGQILLNLLSNAVKFTEVGEVELAVDDVDGALQFAVADTGVGMTPEQQRRVFQPFEQADPSTTRRYGGTGLGLAISERFAALLGGRMTVDSEPGRGTRFVFTLPRAGAP